MPLIRQRRVVDIFAAPLESDHFRQMRLQLIQGKPSGHAAFLVQNKRLFIAMFIHLDTGHAVAFRIDRLGIRSEILEFAHGYRFLRYPL